MHVKILTISLLLFLAGCKTASTPEQIAEEVWQREIQYWDYVIKNDKAGYLTLWHKDFIGYPDSITRKDHISDWLADMHNKKGFTYENNLIKKAVNPFGDVVVTFYDEEDIMKNNQNEIVSMEVYKITHTWKKFGDEWLIIGGMSAVVEKAGNK